MFREVAYIAYHFHWSKDDLMDMAHPERRHWVNEISFINREMNEEDK